MIRQTLDALFLMLKVFKELEAADEFTSTAVHMLLLKFLH